MPSRGTTMPSSTGRPSDATGSRSSNETLQLPRPVKLAEIGYLGRQSSEGQSEDVNSVASHPLTGHRIRAKLLNRAKGGIQWGEPINRLKGISGGTVARCLWTILWLSVVGILWMVVVRLLASDSGDRGDSEEETGYDKSSVTPTVAFAHVSFFLLTLILVAYLWKTVLRAMEEHRAWRLQPDVLPRHRLSHYGPMAGDYPGSTGTPMSSATFAPWNQSLPTYRASILQSRGTGDVEDRVILPPPPPAYGNVRGSRLLLQGLPSLQEQGMGSGASVDNSSVYRPERVSSTTPPTSERESLPERGSSNPLNESNTTRSPIDEHASDGDTTPAIDLSAYANMVALYEALEDLERTATLPHR